MYRCGMSEPSKLPSLSKYPSISDLDSRPELIGVYSYVIERSDPGISIAVQIREGETSLIVGDWHGEPKSPDSFDTGTVLGVVFPKLAAVMKAIGLPTAQFFLDVVNRVVDVQIGPAKFMSPGMMRDLFKKQLSIPLVHEIVQLTPENIVNLKSSGKKLILKPSRFRTVEVIPTVAVPCYATVN
jgi:hypothetical protein